MNTETREYNVYIDESGDEGIKKRIKIFYFNRYNCKQRGRFSNC